MRTNILVNTYICVFILTYSCNKLHLIKICFCCFLVMPLYSRNLSTIATISSLIMLEVFAVCISHSSNFNLSQSSSRSDGKKIVESPEAMIAGDSSNLIKDLSGSLLRPFCLLIKFISFQNS